MRLAGNRPGYTLTELLIALTITAVIGAGFTGVLVNQMKLVDQQEKLSEARSVSRSALNVLLAELRMVEASGITLADDSTLTVRAPFAIGLACASTASATHVALLPVDSALWANSELAGWAYRNAISGNAGYNYVTASVDTTAGASGQCTSVGVGVFNGRVIGLLPPQAATVGASVLLFQDVTFSFRASTSFAGRRALFRRVGTNAPEELVAPFDDGARFRFYVGTGTTSQAAAPADLTTLAGIELVLDARSERPSATGQRDVARLSTAVFFKNR